jgi:hypothetical protein
VSEIVGCHTDMYSGIGLFLYPAVLSSQIGLCDLAASATFLAPGTFLTDSLWLWWWKQHVSKNGGFHELDQRFTNFFQVGTTFISHNVLRTTLLLSPLKAN